jgi:hypothetical protein
VYEKREGICGLLEMLAGKRYVHGSLLPAEAIGQGIGMRRYILDACSMIAVL